MGVVKFFANLGGSPTPPTYLNYVGMLAGSYANEQALNGTDGEIIIPLNNVSRFSNPNNPKNVVSLDFANSGQDISFYIVGANIVISRADTGVREFTGRIIVDDEIVYGRTFEINEEGVIDMVLDSAISVQSNIYISLETTNISFDIVSSNWLFYSTGNIIPPTACEYFELVSYFQQGSQLTCLSPIVGLLRETPLIIQGVNWQGGTAGNRVPRIRNWNTLSSDPSAITIQGQTYYVEATLSQAYGTNKKIYLYFGYDINDRTSSVGIPYINGNLTTPQGFYLSWNPNSVADPLFMFIGESLTLANAYNGTITFKVGTENCPI
jgi:hypothetical protein